MTDNEPNVDGADQYIAWKEWGDEEFFTCNKAGALYFAAEMKSVGIRITQDSQVLEIGFGNGKFAKWVRDISSHYVGTEINPELLSRANAAGFEAHPGTLSVHEIAAGRKFDLIAIFDVVEHLTADEIITLLRSCRACLAKDGRILIRVPNGDSPFSTHLAHGDITHKSLLGSMAIHQLGAMTNLEVLAVKNAAFPALGMGATVAVQRSVIRVLRAIVGAFVRMVFYGNQPTNIYPNMVAVFRISPAR